MPLVSSGVEKGNLRELALARMGDLGLHCRDVRTREAGIQDIHHKVSFTCCSCSLSPKGKLSIKYKSFTSSFFSFYQCKMVQPSLLFFHLSWYTVVHARAVSFAHHSSYLPVCRRLLHAAHAALVTLALQMGQQLQASGLPADCYSDFSQQLVK